MKSFDVIIVGAGVIGVSLAIELRMRSLEVLVLDRGRPGAEASTAGAGMLAASEVEGPDELYTLAHFSAQLFPEFVRQAESISGCSIDFNQNGAICLAATANARHARLSAEQLGKLEPDLSGTSLVASFSAEDFVDPRTLMPALVEWLKREGGHVQGGSPVEALVQENDCVTGVQTRQTRFGAGMVVNCAGAWAGELEPIRIPTRPVKGHMLELLPARPHRLTHVVRHRESDVYLVPRRDGRITVGSTVEEAGFDKRVDPGVIQNLHQLAADLIPELGEARIHEAWTGLRPGTPDGLPILGRTSLTNYFIATGHYRNGILLAPATAHVMADLLTGAGSKLELTPFAPSRFGPTK